jgi:hypothetical protein
MPLLVISDRLPHSCGQLDAKAVFVVEVKVVIFSHDFLQDFLQETFKIIKPLNLTTVF